MNMTDASAETKPSAATSKAWQWPVGDSMPWAEPEDILRGSSMIDTPPARAASLSPSCRLRHALWMASRLDEQAESTVYDGPCAPRWYETRPEARLKLLPVKPYGPSMAWASAASSW